MPSYIKQVNWTGQNPGQGSNYSWIDVNGATTQGWVTLNELGNDSWEFVIAENATGSTRTATFKVQHWTWEQGTNDQDLSDEFTITQYAAQSGGNPPPASPTFTYNDWTGSVSVNADGTVSIQPGNATTVITNPSSVSANTTPGTEQVSMNVTVTVPAGYANAGATVSNTITLTQPTSYVEPTDIQTIFSLQINSPYNGVTVSSDQPWQSNQGQYSIGGETTTNVGDNQTFVVYLTTDDAHAFTNANQAEVVPASSANSGPGGWGGGEDATHTTELLPDGRIKVTISLTTADPMLDTNNPSSNILLLRGVNVSPIDVEIPTYSAFTMFADLNGLQGTTITSPDDNGSNWNNYTFDSSGHVEGEEVTHTFWFRATDWSSSPAQGTNFESVDDINVVTMGNTPAGAVTITKELLGSAELGGNTDEQLIRVTVVRNMTVDGWTTTLQASGAPVSQVPEQVSLTVELHDQGTPNSTFVGGTWTSEGIYTIDPMLGNEGGQIGVNIFVQPTSGYQFTNQNQVQFTAINGTDPQYLQFFALANGNLVFQYLIPSMPANNVTASFDITANPVAIINPEYNSFTRTPAIVDEGNAVTFTLTSTDIPQGTTIAATVSGVGAADFSNDDLSWSFEIGANGQATKTINITQDSSTEGNETATVTLAATDSAGNQVFSSAGDRTLTFGINDTSTDDILEFTNTGLQLLLWNDSGNKTRAFSMNRDATATYTWTVNNAGGNNSAQPGQIYFSNTANGSPVVKPTWVDAASASGDNSGGILTYSVTQWPWTDDSSGGGTPADPNNPGVLPG